MNAAQEQQDETAMTQTIHDISTQLQPPGCVDTVNARKIPFESSVRIAARGCCGMMLSQDYTIKHNLLV